MRGPRSAEGGKAVHLSRPLLPAAGGGVTRLRGALLCAAVACSLGIVVASVLTGPLRSRIGAALDELGSASTPLVAVSGAWALAALVCGALGWRATLRALGMPVGRVDAIARYTIGSALNAAAPARLGGAVRFALFARVGGVRAAGASAAALGAAHAAVLVPLALVAGLSGVVPLWAAAAAGLGAVVCAGVAIVAGGHRSVLPSALLWVSLTTVARLGAATSAAAALGAPHPLLAGLLVVPATALAAFVPLTPGAIGVATAAGAMAISSVGADAATALAAALALGLAETTASLGLGSLGGLLLAGIVPGLRPSRWRTRVVAVDAPRRAAAPAG
jgi:uncharacterized membrane protein YbhN (UPF0104 family)